MMRLGLGRILPAIVLVLAVVASGTVPAQAQRGDWVVLGEKQVRIGLDKDFIELNRRDGRFDALKLEVRSGNVFLIGMTIVYGNGLRQDVDANFLMRDGAETDAFDLRGESRFLDRIELRYGSLDFGGSRATVRVLGRQVRGRARVPSVANRGRSFRDLGRGWSRIGRQSVDGRRDIDAIQLDTGDGRFSEIVLRVIDGQVRLRELSVTYGNGETEELRPGDVLEAGEESEPLVFRTRRGRNGRFIDRIEMRYGATRRSGRRAVVEIWGRRVGRGRGNDARSGGVTGVARPANRQGAAPRRGSRPRQDLDLLGSARVLAPGESARIDVGRREGVFERLIIEAAGGDVPLRSVSVVFGNRQRADFNVRRVIREGDRVELRIDQGRRDGRRVRDIDVTFGRGGNDGRRVRAIVYGDRAR